METTVPKPAFLTELLAEIDAFEASLFPPDRPVQKGETVLGEAPPYAQKIWALSRYYDRENERAAVELKFQKKDSADERRHLHMAVESEAKSQCLLRLMWSILSQTFDTWGTKKIIGLREGWKVVEFEEPESPMEKFARLFGQ